MMNFIERKVYPDLKKHLATKYITVITGLRRTGKTTLVKKLLEDFKSDNKIYIDLERYDYRELFSEKNYDNVIISLSSRNLNFKKKALIAIDEIQLAPNAISVIKYLYDNYDIKFIVTGSSSYYIKNLFAESLAGRKKVFVLNTLNFGEFLNFKKIEYSSKTSLGNKFNASEYERLKKYYAEFISFGGFPDVVLAKSKNEKRDVIKDILNSYLRIDLKNISEIRDLSNVQTLLKMLASRAATRLDYSKISALTGIARTSIYNYMDLLENTFVITRIKVTSTNSDREIVKAPKIFLNDNGLLNELAQLSSGVQFENAVFNQLRVYGTINYYSLKTGKEIDFVVNKNTAIEAKETATSHDYVTLKNLAKNLGIKKCFLVSRFPSPSTDKFIWGGDIQ